MPVSTLKRYLALLGMAVVVGVITGLIWAYLNSTSPTQTELDQVVEQAHTFQATRTAPPSPNHEPIYLNGWAVLLVGLILAAVWVGGALIRDLMEKNRRRIEMNRPYRVRMLHPTFKPLKGITPCSGRWRWRGVVGKRSRHLHEIKFTSPLRSYVKRIGHHR